MSLSLILNPVSGQFDFIDDGGAYWQSPVATVNDLPLTDDDGTCRVAKDTDKIYVWDASSSKWIDTGITASTFGSTPNSTGLSISTSTTGNITSRTIILQPADVSNPGAISTAAQTLSGSKTFNDGIKTDTIQTKAAAATLNIGTDGNASTINLGANGASIVVPANILANGGIDVTATAGTDTLNLGNVNADIVNVGKTGSTVNVSNLAVTTSIISPSVDVAATAGTDTLNIGTTNADVVNIGSATTQVNIYGSVTDVEATNTVVKDKIITLNEGGLVTSGDQSGIEIEENNVITGYSKTSSDRNSWQLKAPNTAGIATITPGVAGITLDQSSHNPITISDTNSIDLSLSTQQISADLNLSANAADVGNQLVNLDIQSTGDTGLRAQIANTSIQAAISVSDTNSIDMSYSSGAVSGDIKLSNNSADTNNQIVSLDIQTTGTTGLRAQIPNSSITGLITVADSNSIDMSYTTGQVSGDVKLSSNVADTNNTKVALNIESTSSVGIRAQVPHAALAVEGVVNTAAQTFGGAKTFNDSAIITGMSGNVITSTNIKSAIEQLDESQYRENNTGLLAWTGAGNYYSIGSNQVTILRGGSGFIKGKKITWTAPQTTATLTANAENWVYVDSTGTVSVTATFTSTFLEDNILLCHVLYDGTTYLVVNQTHPYAFNSTISEYFHNNVGTVIRGAGAIITRVSTGTGASTGDREVKIVGSDYVDDHGLSSTISDSSGAGVTWNIYYTNASGKWIRYAAQTQLPMFYNNAGTPTALGTGPANDNGVYTLYVSNNDLNSATPQYIAVMNNAVYSTVAAANAAITNGTTARATNELLPAELAQLGYAIVENNGTSGYINTLIVAKTTFNSKIIGSGASTSAALISTNTTNFDGGLSSTDTTVQTALETLDNKFASTDINPTNFTAANNQVAAADVTGLLFDPTKVRGFEAIVTVEIDATADLFEIFKLYGIYNGTSWYFNYTSVGSDSNVDFSITNAGQVQYTSGNEAGFSSSIIRFRAQTLRFA